MARKAVLASTAKGHQTAEQKRARSQVEARWRRGSIAEYEPLMLNDSALVVFQELALAMPDELLAKVDGYTIEAAADAIDKMRTLRETIDAEGVIVDGEQNKAVFAYQKYSDIAKKFLVELGLTPSARSKIAADAAAKAAKPKGIRDALAEDDEG